MERMRDNKTWQPITLLALVFLLIIASDAHALSVSPSLSLSFFPSLVPQARQFTIDTAKSEITVSLAQEGVIRKRHPSHTIAVRNYTSKLSVPKDEAKTSFEISVEAKSLVNVDKTMGDFERKGFQHVLHTQVLESERFPQIVFKSGGLAALKKNGDKRNFTLTGTLTFRGVSRQVSFPVSATFGKDAITATGSAKIKQTDFGITPYADALGAIKVGDEMTINFSIVAKVQ